MNWVAIGAFSSGSSLIAIIEFTNGHIIAGGVAVLLGITLDTVVWLPPRRYERTLSALAFIGTAGVYFSMHLEVGTYAALGAVTLILIGWEAGLSAREIAPFPKPAQGAFTRARIPLLLAIAAIGVGVGTATSTVRLHLNFGLALTLSAVAFALLVALFTIIRPNRGGQ